ncbi:MAG: hypothetical protein HOP12_11810 [Candidatus Eisenbacteria bacterium]|uniref:Big-1 domain-containing protein n=1 Tax=Eiseniibacteriota bacterium TaxID=2212470 RepID=A0A849T0I6_UNCEI|nr:hypothetical protein [Candidatus Eisenbacteria bacterium]
MRSLRSNSCLALALLCVCAAPTRALAGVPSPLNTTIPLNIVVCPQADIPFTMVVRDAANNPVVGSFVELNFSTCSVPAAYPNDVPVRFCPSDPGPGITPIGPGHVAALTNAAGVVTFFLRAGGVCVGSAVEIRADGVSLGQRGAASPDQNGSLSVFSNPDALELVAKESVALYDVTADLDSDGDTNTDAGDIAVYDAHAGHTCDARTPTRDASWGRLKTIYR